MKEKHFESGAVSPEPIEPLTISPYLDALEGVQTQFTLIRFALSKLSQAEIQEFFQRRLKQKLDLIAQAFQTMMKDMKPAEKDGLPKVEEMLVDDVNKKHKSDSNLSNAAFQTELSEDRLNQSELLLLVAHFESFMKDVHRTLLTACPAKFFSRQKTEVTYCDVFSGSSGDPFGKFLRESIIKEVKRLDQQKNYEASRVLSKILRDFIRVSGGDHRTA